MITKREELAAHPVGLGIIAKDTLGNVRYAVVWTQYQGRTGVKFWCPAIANLPARLSNTRKLNPDDYIRVATIDETVRKRPAR